MVEIDGRTTGQIECHAGAGDAVFLYADEPKMI